MSKRRSLQVEGFSHQGQPIPAACQIGGLIITGGVYGLDPATGAIPDDVEHQTALMFANLERILAAGGATFEDVGRMTIFVKTAAARQAINPAWEAAFPDPASRPARHTQQNDHLPANLLIQCDAIAWVGG